jgi:hypothetical protein
LSLPQADSRSVRAAVTRNAGRVERRESIREREAER